MACTVLRSRSARWLAAALVACVAIWSGAARADAVMSARHTIEEAAITVDQLREETAKGGELDNLLTDAKGVLIVPSFYKAGFIIGGAYGDGVLLARLPDGTFSDPAFYRMTAGSLGLQIGMESQAVVFVIRTEKGLSAVMNDEFKMGANAGLAIGTIGAGAEAATTTHVGDDIVAYSKNSGLFVGGSIEGAAIQPRQDWNAAVYGVGNDDPREIIQRSGLRAAINLKDVLSRAPAGVVSQPSQAATTPSASAPAPTAPPASGVNSSPVQPESEGK